MVLPSNGKATARLLETFAVREPRGGDFFVMIFSSSEVTKRGKRRRLLLTRASEEALATSHSRREKKTRQRRPFSFLCCFNVLLQSGIICILVDNLIKSQIYSDYVQAHLAPSGYLKIPTDMPEYLEGCKFLPKLNNELPSERNSTYKERFSSLENLILIMIRTVHTARYWYRTSTEINSVHRYGSALALRAWRLSSGKRLSVASSKRITW
ncbi:hypothetical protein GW17_00010359 [Ensete ventricosum]|nr:hypothetical protein GW17_00010359 [Ensete ventricosum]